MLDWKELEQRCLTCQKCGLADTRTHVVFGTGTHDAEIMCIGEGPGENEDLQGGICGYRELESWVWSYMTTGDLLKSVKNTVISKAALLAEDRKILMDTFVMPHFCAYEEENNDGIQRK